MTATMAGPSGELLRLPRGTRGFDCNHQVDDEAARALWEKGYRFAVRYVRRSAIHDYDLTRDEIGRLFDAGLAVMPVQHVESERSWQPSAEKGRANGWAAASSCKQLGIPDGVTVWCDLEGTADDAAAESVAEYCQMWHAAVRTSGYQPGLYVGWHSGLTADALYHRLAFQHYWSSYNLNADEEPAVRGVQMRQHAAHGQDTPAKLPFAIDVDVVVGDRLGGVPTAYAPMGWIP